MDSGIHKRTWRNSPWTVVVGFPLLVLLAFALNFLLQHRPPHFHDPATDCRNNLKQIAVMKALWAEDEGKSAKDTPTTDALMGTNTFLRGVFDCPVGGNLTLGAVGEKPRCSIPGHTI